MNNLNQRLDVLERKAPKISNCYIQYIDDSDCDSEYERTSHCVFEYSEAEALTKHNETCPFKHQLGDDTYKVFCIKFIGMAYNDHSEPTTSKGATND